MTVERTPDGPKSAGVLTYSPSTDPTSPPFADQTGLYANKGWGPLHHDLADARATAAARLQISP